MARTNLTVNAPVDAVLEELEPMIRQYVDHLRTEFEEMTKLHDAKHQDWRRAEAAIERARAEAERWREDLKANERESWAVAARHVCAMILDALTVPEGPMAADHTPPAEATCPERWAARSTAHACSWISHEGDVHKCRCGDVWDTGKVGCRAVPAASTTGEDLRERLTERLNTTLVTPDGGIEQSDSKFDRHDRHNFLYNCAACQGNVPAIVSALLAEVSPALERQQAEIERLTDFGLESRERHQAELERLRADLAEARAAAEQFAAEGNADLARFNQYREWTAEVVAERDELKAANEQVRAVFKKRFEDAQPGRESCREFILNLGGELAAALEVHGAPESPESEETTDG